MYAKVILQLELGLTNLLHKPSAQNYTWVHSNMSFKSVPCFKTVFQRLRYFCSTPVVFCLIATIEQIVFSNCEVSKGTFFIFAFGMETKEVGTCSKSDVEMFTQVRERVGQSKYGFVHCYTACFVEVKYKFDTVFCLCVHLSVCML